MVHQPHRLRRSRDDRFIAGVAGGLAEYFDVDPVLVRMGWILLTMATVGLAVLFYIGLATMMPNDRLRESRGKSANDAAPGKPSGLAVAAGRSLPTAAPLEGLVDRRARRFRLFAIRSLYRGRSAVRARRRP